MATGTDVACYFLPDIARIQAIFDRPTAESFGAPVVQRVSERSIEDKTMRQTISDQRMSAWVVDYSAARARAIAWLGDRYLLATPVKRLDNPALGRASLAASGMSTRGIAA